jgi:hypothetical protein
MGELEYEIYINDCFIARVVSSWLNTFINGIMEKQSPILNNMKIEIKVVE